MHETRRQEHDICIEARRDRQGGVHDRAVETELYEYDEDRERDARNRHRASRLAVRDQPPGERDSIEAVATESHSIDLNQEDPEPLTKI